MTNIFVLVCEYNLYDQQGQYYLALFKDLPTEEQLIENGLSKYEASKLLSIPIGYSLPYNNDISYSILKEPLL